jgi:hypothetical protein
MGCLKARTEVFEIMTPIIKDHAGNVTPGFSEASVLAVIEYYRQFRSAYYQRLPT